MPFAWCRPHSMVAMHVPDAEVVTSTHKLWVRLDEHWDVGEELAFDIMNAFLDMIDADGEVFSVKDVKLSTDAETVLVVYLVDGSLDSELRQLVRCMRDFAGTRNVYKGFSKVFGSPVLHVFQ